MKRPSLMAKACAGGSRLARGEHGAVSGDEIGDLRQGGAGREIASHRSNQGEAGDQAGGTQHHILQGLRRPAKRRLGWAGQCLSRELRRGKTHSDQLRPPSRHPPALQVRVFAHLVARPATLVPLNLNRAVTSPPLWSVRPRKALAEFMTMSAPPVNAKVLPPRRSIRARHSCALPSCWRRRSPASRHRSRRWRAETWRAGLCRSRDCRSYRRFRPLSAQRGHPAISPRRRRMGGTALPARARPRSRPRGAGAQWLARRPVSRRDRSAAPSRPVAGRPAILIPNPFYAAYAAGAGAADCEVSLSSGDGAPASCPILTRSMMRCSAHGRDVPRSPSNPQGAVADLAYLSA